MAKRKRLKKTSAPPPKANSVHDLIAVDIPENAEIAIVEMDNPLYDSVSPAQWDADRGEWRAGDRERIRTAKSLKSDPVGRMHARGQIGDAEHKAAVGLQVLHDRAQIGVIRAIDPTRDVVDGGQLPEILTDTQQSAIRRIRSIESAITKKHGVDGLALLNGVLIGRMTVEQYVHKYALDFLSKLEFWRCLFQKCLRTLGREMGTVRDMAA